MPLYRPSELMDFLSSLGVAPKRALSQNFLIDGNIVSKIVDEVQPSSEMCILEIGPGPGVLTEAFLERGADVVAVEKDDAFATALARLDPAGERLSVIAADIMDCSMRALVASHCEKKIVAVSNLPYHLTTPIVQRLIEARDFFPKAVLMMQEEVARRLTGAKPSLLGISASFFYHVTYLFRVSRGCFWPKPHVDSAILSFERIVPPIPEGIEQEAFFDIIREAFLHRRKTVLHSLQQKYSKEALMAALEQSGLSHDVRPEELGIAQWVSLFKAL